MKRKVLKKGNERVRRNTVKEFYYKARKNFRSSGDVWLFSQIIFTVATLPVAIRFFSFRGLLRAFTPRTMKSEKRLEIEEFKDKLVRFTDYILSWKYLIGKNFCLKRSLILYHFLRKSGMDVHLCFGVKFNGMLHTCYHPQKKLEGHAWLLYRGEIYLERDIEGTKAYKMTYIFPGREKRSSA